MSDRRLILAVLAGALLVSPAAASAADYHHVHLTASNATEAIGWYSPQQQQHQQQPAADAWQQPADRHRSPLVLL